MKPLLILDGALTLHWKYRHVHTILHAGYQSVCGEPCPLASHVLLQDAIVAVRRCEKAIRLLEAEKGE